uniref:Uncharacterized protein n=1 Tax=Sphenodon punctatus TaxID=8508 RepID=A0A8D0GVV8_SPHPU
MSTLCHLQNSTFEPRNERKNGYINGHKSEFFQCLSDSSKTPELLSVLVKKNKNKMLRFEKEQGFELRVCDLDGTVYKEQPCFLEYWKNLYLPKPTKMVVLGAIDDVPCLAHELQLVILVAEDGSVYAYEEDLLHKIGKNVKEFCEDGLLHFGEEVYPCGKGLKTKSEEELGKDPEIQRLWQSTEDFEDSDGESFEDLLDFLKSP